MVTTSKYKRKLAEKYIFFTLFTESVDYRSPQTSVGVLKTGIYLAAHTDTHTNNYYSLSLTFIWLLTLTALLQSVPLSHPSEKWAETPWSMQHSCGDVTFKLPPLCEMTQQPVCCRKLALFKHRFSWEPALLSFIGGKRMWGKKKRWDVEQQILELCLFLVPLEESLGELVHFCVCALVWLCVAARMHMETIMKPGY